MTIRQALLSRFLENSDSAYDTKKSDSATRPDFIPMSSPPPGADSLIYDDSYCSGRDTTGTHRLQVLRRMGAVKAPHRGFGPLTAAIRNIDASTAAMDSSPPATADSSRSSTAAVDECHRSGGHVIQAPCSGCSGVGTPRAGTGFRLRLLRRAGRDRRHTRGPGVPARRTLLEEDQASGSN